MRPTLTTTTIGSFPKPKYLPIRDWFDSAKTSKGMNDPQTTKEYSKSFGNFTNNDETLFIQAAREIIDIQIRSGIDIPTDGEVRRENYIHYHCRYIKGFDFENLEHQVLRDGAYETDLPAIRGIVRHGGKPYAAKDFTASQNVSPSPLKFTLPGPLTIMDTNANCFYSDRAKLNRDIADTINQEIMGLVEAGCKYIQIDEPLFARQIDDTINFGLEGLERCFHGVPKEVKRIVHMCCGYPDFLDDENYKKADPQSYFILSEIINQAKFDQLSIEDAHCLNDLKLLEKFPDKSIIFGAIAVARSKIENVDSVAHRIEEALKHIDRDRLIIAPDCGLGLLSPEQAEAKLKIMVEATSKV
jgi:5-methyltetrahydropteroyltriglutamate--homocysteine methyltransferase